MPKRQIIFLSCLVAGYLSGCSPETGSRGGLTAELPPATDLALAGSPNEGDVGLFRDRSRVKVGDPWDRASTVFPEPPKGAYELKDLPANFPTSYEAKGWETPSGEGFGVILKDSKVVAAMYELERAKKDDLDQYVQLETAGMSKLKLVTLQGNRLRYWFWLDPKGHQTAMILARNVISGLNLTVAMGDDNIVRALGISLDAAKKEVLPLSQTPPVAPNSTTSPQTKN